MYKSQKILGLIPARGGSKGLPRKNVLPFLGKPLISWTIEQARCCRYLDELLVSTDDAEIARVAQECGAVPPFIRPSELAADDSKTIDVIIHALNEAGEKRFDYLLLLEPTSPLREVEDIDRSIETLIDHPIGKSLVSVAKLEGAHPEFSVAVDLQTGCIRRLDGSADFGHFRRQELSDVYCFEGSIYASEIATLVSRKTFYHELTLPYLIPRWKAVEIDEKPDFVCAEALKRARLEGLF